MNEQEWIEIFGDNLKSLMEEKGYNQQNLSDAIGISQPTISRYLQKRQMPTIKALVNLVYELNVSFDELMDFGSRIE